MMASLFIVCSFAPSYRVGWRSAVHGKSREAEERREELVRSSGRGADRLCRASVGSHYLNRGSRF